MVVGGNEFQWSGKDGAQNICAATGAKLRFRGFWPGVGVESNKPDLKKSGLRGTAGRVTRPVCPIPGLR